MFSYDVRTIIDLIRYHGPIDDLKVVPVVLASAVTGLVLCLGGARAVKTLITALLAVLGAALGAWVSEPQTPFPAWMTVTLGTIAGAGIGYKGYRVWVGCGSGLMLAALVLTVYMFHTVLPHHHSWSGVGTRSAVASSSASSSSSFRIPSFRQARLRGTTPTAYFNRFGDYFAQQEPSWRLHLALMMVPAAVGGLIFGTLAPKVSSILWTSLIGTAFFVTAVIAVMVAYRPQWETSFVLHADWVGWLALTSAALSCYFQHATTKKPDPGGVQRGRGEFGGGGGGGRGSH